MANNIYTQSSYKDLVFLRAGCGCGNKEHSHDIVISVADDMPFVLVQIDTNVAACEWDAEYNGTFLTKMFARIKSAFTILLTGRLQMEATFYFSSKQQVQDYLKAIGEAYDHVEKSLPDLQKNTRNN